MKHQLQTPGPWFVGKKSANGWSTVRVADAGCSYGRVIAETVEPTDAKAIALLPELVEALKKIERALGGASNGAIEHEAALCASAVLAKLA